MTVMSEPPPGTLTGPILDQVANFPRIRYMGSKYRVIPYLVGLFSALSFEDNSFSLLWTESDGAAGLGTCGASMLYGTRTK